jgi:hypothetical protein
MIRVKSHLGGAFDAARLADPDFNLFAEPPFDKAAVIEYLLGPIAEVFCYGGPAARLASFKFAAAGRYGVHEAIVSSGLTMKSDGAPTDDLIEITGTDGILWLRNLTATMVEAPKLMLKRKDVVTVWDDHADYDLAGVAAAQRAHFAAVLRGKAKPRLTVEQAARAVLLNAAAHEAWKTARPVRVAALAGAAA